MSAVQLLLVAAAAVAFLRSSQAGEPVPFVAAKHFTPGRRSPVRLVVLHSAEDSSARSVAAGFALGALPKRSTHYAVDARETIRCVRDGDTAYGAPGANEDGLQIEICGWARWTAAEWQASGVLPRVAGLVRRLCLERGLPIAHVDVAGLVKGARGVTTHAEVAKAFGRSDHTDPGPGFPLASVLAAARI